MKKGIIEKVITDLIYHLNALKLMQNKTNTVIKEKL